LQEGTCDAVLNEGGKDGRIGHQDVVGGSFIRQESHSALLNFTGISTDFEDYTSLAKRTHREDSQSRLLCYWKYI
jgi:hypothetical protein